MYSTRSLPRQASFPWFTSRVTLVAMIIYLSTYFIDTQAKQIEMDSSSTTLRNQLALLPHWEWRPSTNTKCSYKGNRPLVEAGLGKGRHYRAQCTNFFSKMRQTEELKSTLQP